MSDEMTAPMFDIEAQQPADSPPEGLGQDALRTWRQKREIEQGRHPATKLPLAPESSGRQCGNCAQLYRKTNGNGVWWKCTTLRKGSNDGPDMRKWWPGCMAHTFADGGAR